MWRRLGGWLFGCWLVGSWHPEDCIIFQPQGRRLPKASWRWLRPTSLVSGQLFTQFSTASTSSKKKLLWGLIQYFMHVDSSNLLFPGRSWLETSKTIEWQYPRLIGNQCNVMVAMVKMTMVWGDKTWGRQRQIWSATAGGTLAGIILSNIMRQYTWWNKSWILDIFCDRLFSSLRGGPNWPFRCLE